MNNGDMNERISMVRFAIVLFRVMYVILFVLSALLLVNDGLTAGVAFGILGVIILVTNISMKFYLKKLEKCQNEQNTQYQERVKTIMEEQLQIAEDINKNINFEIDESKINYSELDKERIAKNCNVMKKNRLPYQENMKLIPFDAIVKVKTKEEIAKQMIEEFIVAQKAINKLNGISDIQDQGFVTMVLKYQPDKNVLSMLSQISNGEIDEFILNQLAYLYERVNVYMWVLGLASKPLANKQCYPAFIIFTLDKYSNFDNLLSGCKMRSYNEIMEYADLVTRYEWAMIELDKKGQLSKKINRDSVAEQKRAMDWVTSFDSNMLIKQKDC